MGWPSYMESIDAIRCDLEHLACHASESRACPSAAAPTVVAAAERALLQIWEILEVATEPGLDTAAELVRLRATTALLDAQRAADQRRIEVLRRDAMTRARETAYWRDAYLEASRQRFGGGSRPRTRRRR